MLLRRILLIFALPAVLAIGSVDANAQKIIDLSLPRPLAVSAPVGAPGASVGGTAHGPDPFPKPYPLPLEVTIRSLAPTNNPNGPSFVMEILVRNVGQTAFALPISDEPSGQPILLGNRNRREFGFTAWAQVPGEKGVGLLLGTGAFVRGSETTPDSLLKLPPQGSVVIRYPVELGPAQNWSKERLALAEVKASVSEWTLEDDQYTIKNFSQNVYSKNSVRISEIEGIR
jgi:hypothetical protein